jgi:hypothetical protein
MVAREVENSDGKLSLLLLDKVKEKKEVIELIIRMLGDRARPAYFCEI